MPRLGTRAQHRNVALRVEQDVGRTGRQYGLRRRRCPDGWYTAVHRDLSPRNTLLTVADEDTGLVACDHLCAGAPQPPSGLEPADQTVVTVDTPVTLRWSGNAGVAEVDIEYERGNWSHCGLFTGGSCIFTPTSVGYYLWDVGTGTNAFTPNPSMGSEQHYIVVDAAGQSGHPVILTWSTTAAYCRGKRRRAAKRR